MAGLWLKPRRAPVNSERRDALRLSGADRAGATARLVHERWTVFAAPTLKETVRDNLSRAMETGAHVKLIRSVIRPSKIDDLKAALCGSTSSA